MASEFEVKIAAEGKIKAWDVHAKKDKLTFSGLVLTAGQLESVARLIRIKKRGEVRCAIEPLAKRLGLKPISSAVRIDGCDILKAGILPSISGFIVPADRGDTMCRLIREETLLMVTFEVIQGDLAFKEDTPATEDAEAGESKPESFEEDQPPVEPVVIKCKGLKQATVNARIQRTADGYTCSADLTLGNYHDTVTLGDAVKSRKAALEVLKHSVNQWLDNLEITGTSDAKRATSARRANMREQVNARLDELIAASNERDRIDRSDSNQKS